MRSLCRGQTPESLSFQYTLCRCRVYIANSRAVLSCFIVCLCRCKMNVEERGMQRCAATLCTNTSRNCKVSFFAFPSDVERSKLWIVACHREDLLQKQDIHKLSYKLCGMHFEGR
ncbi:unnamed protein product, partial [Callosobruchus maculatus]